jgi:hypothetical protein
VIVSECSDFESHGKGLMYFMREILPFKLSIQFIPMSKPKFIFSTKGVRVMANADILI